MSASGWTHSTDIVAMVSSAKNPVHRRAGIRRTTDFMDIVIMTTTHSLTHTIIHAIIIDRENSPNVASFLV